VRTYFFSPFFFKCVFGRFSAREVRKHENLFFQFKKKSPGNIFSIFFPGDLFLTSFSFVFFVALVKRLSVRGTQRRDEKVLRGRASNLFPFAVFF
jgi:hypothetical protein